MKKSKRRFFSGDTVDQAVIAAASEYNISPAEVAFKQVDRQHGFLRNKKQAVIEVDPKAPRKEVVAGSEVPAKSEPALAPVAPPASKPGSSEGESPKKESKLEEVEPVLGESPEEAPAERAAEESTSDAGAEGGGSEDGDPEVARPVEASPARKEAAPRGPARDEARKEEEPSDDGGEELDGEELDDEEELTPAEEAVDLIITLTGLDLEWEIEESADRVEVVFDGKDADLLLREHGKSLFAVEHLLPKVIRGISGEKVFCHVDSQGFRENRRVELEELALSAADEVKDSGEPKTLPLLNPSERRIVHMTLADDEDVDTESEGGGYLKRLTIWPS